MSMRSALALACVALFGLALGQTLHDDEHFNYWLSTLANHSLTKVRKSAAYHLGKMDELRARPYLENAALNDASFEVRAEAAHALGRLGSLDSLATLQRMENYDEHPNARRVASRSIALIEGRQEHIEKLKKKYEALEAQP